MVGCRWRRTIRTPPTNRNCTMGSRQKPSPDSTRVTGYSAVHSVGENRASHELAACRQKRRPPESRPMIVDLWSANTKLVPNRLRGDRSANDIQQHDASSNRTSGPRRPQSVLVHRFSVTYDSGIILRTAKVPSQLELVSRRSVHEKAILRQLRQESRLRTTQR